MPLVPILLFHNVSPDPPPAMAPFAVTPEVFRAQMEQVVSTGATTSTVSDWIAARSLRGEAPRTVLVTFDDGFADFAEHALPAPPI